MGKYSVTAEPFAGLQMSKDASRMLCDTVSKMGISELLAECEKFNTEFCCKPDRKKFPRYRTGDVVDENMSVRWNREEVERANAAFDAEVKCLNRRKAEVIGVYENAIVKVVSQEAHVSVAEGTVLWKYARRHGGNVYDTKNIFDDYAEVYHELLEAREATLGKRNRKRAGKPAKPPEEDMGNGGKVEMEER